VGHGRLAGRQGLEEERRVSDKNGCEQPLPECLGRIARIEETVDEVKSGVVAIREAVFGNGDPANSLIVRHKSVADAMEKMDKRHARSAARQSKMLWGIIVGIVSLLAAVAKDVTIDWLTKEKVDESPKVARVADAVPAGRVPADGM